MKKIEYNGKKIFELLSIKDENWYLKEMINNGSIRKFIIQRDLRIIFVKCAVVKCGQKASKKEK